MTAREIEKAITALVKRRALTRGIRVKKLTARGIYFLFDNEELVYIGQTINLLSRLPSHAAEKIFDFVRFFQYDGDLTSLEMALIVKFKPKYNKQARNGDGKKTSERIRWGNLQEVCLKRARDAIAECLRVHGNENYRNRALRWTPDFRLDSI